MSALRNFLRSTATLVLGQRLYLVGEALQGKLAQGHYILSGMERVNATTGKMHILRVTSLDPLEVEHPAIEVEWPLDKVQAYTGAALGHVAADNYVTQYFKWMTTKAKRPELFDPKVNYDKIFQGTAAKYIARYPFHLDPEAKRDLIVDCLQQVVTLDTIKKADAGLDLVKYFGGMFAKRVITWLTNENNRRKKQKFKPSGDERTDDEWMDSQTGPGAGSDEELDYKDLVTGLAKFFQSKGPQGKYFLAILTYLPQGYSNKELADKLKVSPSIVTRYLQQFKEAMLEYAKKTKNDALYTQVQEILKQRKHDLETAADKDPLVKWFQKLKKKGSTDTADSGREPAGQVTKVRRKSMPDVLHEDYMAKLILSDRITQDKIDESAEEFLALLANSQDIVEDGSTIVSLRVDTTEARSSQDLAVQARRDTKR